MKDIWIRLRCWISWRVMPKEVRPIFVNAVHKFADELLKELEELKNERKGEE